MGDKSETMESILASIKLKGSNYLQWSKAVEVFLKARGKVAHLKASKPAADSEDLESWAQADAEIITWLWNSMEPHVFINVAHLDTAKDIWDTLKEMYSADKTISRTYQLYHDIFALQQGDRSVGEYYSELKGMWDELNVYQPLTADIETQRLHREEFRVAKFLSGLKPELAPISARILSGGDVPSASEVFARIQRGVLGGPPSTNAEQYAPRVPTGRGTPFRGGRTYFGGRTPSGGRDTRGGRGRGRGRGRGNMMCSHCGRINHTVDYCWELYGKPAWANQGLNDETNAGAPPSSSTAAPVDSADAETGSFKSNIEREDSEGGLFTSTSSVEDHGKSNCTFAAPPSMQGPTSASKRYYRRKSSMRTGQDSHNSTPNDEVPLTSSPRVFPATSTSVHLDPTQGLNGIPFVPKTENNNIADKNKKPAASQASVATDGASIAAQEMCEKWRFRGNQAYANGHLSEAEDYYTRGVNSISQNETSRSCIRSLMLCYSNRAATRMSLGRMQEAVSDCTMAIAIDPDFLRAQVRAANCYLALGEIKDALKHFKKCLQSENDANSNQKILIEASEGLRKAQQVADYMDQSAELLRKRTTNDATKALQIASEALSISPHSENLMEMKAESLLMLRNYEEVIQFCKETLDSTKKSSIVTGAEGQSKDADSSRYMESSHERLWRWRLISKSYFLLGKLEEAVEILEKHENVKTVPDKYRSWSPDSSTSLMVTIRKLLRHKAAGNEAFQAGRHSEAVEHYTAALACNSESRPFVAICFCNRAASYQALGLITDAIADCSLAIALDASYIKAISRRATLHQMIRDYGQAANDLKRLISLLEKHLKDKDNTSATLVRSTANSGDLKRARLRLSTMEEEAGKGTPLDMYMILGIDPSSSAADVKKAYRKAALSHHPDKAGHFLARSENACDGLWREVADEVHIYADQLFKMIGEAYTVLSDPTKRQKYDAEDRRRGVA